MSNPIIKIVNVVTGEEIEREMTAAEVKKEADSVKLQQERDAEIAQINAPKIVARQAILDRLGLTAEEAALLLS
jgi:hypothetical protein